jgi:hypothetical protein
MLFSYQMSTATQQFKMADKKWFTDQLDCAADDPVSVVQDGDFFREHPHFFPLQF